MLKCRQDLIFKKQLPCFTPAGIFSHRSENGLVHYNGTQTLDIDGVDHPEILKEVCKSIPWVFAAFITPSGKGLKVIIRTNAVREEFTAVGIEVNEHFRQITGYNRDENCKDISRIHYVSWDKGLYLNESAEVFKKTTPS